MSIYRRYTDRLQTPQTEPIPGRETDMVENAAGGFGFTVDKWTQLTRFILLGTEGGSYYVSEAKLTKENATNVADCIKEDGARVVRTIVEISQAGRAAKNDPALFVLAMASGIGDESTRKLALEALPDVARTGAALLLFGSYIEGFRGWGRGLRNAVAAWYEVKSPRQLQYQLIKYQQRYGWSHRDLLRLSHPTPVTPEHDVLFNYVTFNRSEDPDRIRSYEQALRAIKANEDGRYNTVYGYELAKEATDAKSIVRFITDYGLPREAIPTQFLNDRDVWEALVQDMPMTALIRNLGKMSSVGLLKQGEFDLIKKVTDQITDRGHLKAARVHPIAILAALKTYESGQGFRGSNTWGVVPDVVAALDEAFYKAFEFVEPANKRHYLAIDVSSSMTVGACTGVPSITPNVGAAAMAMVTYKTEPKVVVKGFAHTLRELPFSRISTLKEAMRATQDMSFGGTDCALPMIDALNEGMEIDTFVVYTDQETWAGAIHPMQALQEYRRKMNIPARLVIVGMTSTGYSIADPNDGGALDVVGFSTDTPQVISQFSAGNI